VAARHQRRGEPGLGRDGVEYVDTFTPGVGHETCQRVGVRWVEGVANITNGAPIHPNGDGMAAFARLVVAKLG